MTEKQGFELRVHFLSARRTVSAEPDGLGWQLQTDSGRLEVHSLEQAVQVGEQHMGEFLAGSIADQDGY